MGTIHPELEALATLFGFEIINAEIPNHFGDPWILVRIEDALLAAVTIRFGKNGKFMTSQAGAEALKKVGVPVAYDNESMQQVIYICLWAGGRVWLRHRTVNPRSPRARWFKSIPAHQNFGVLVAQLAERLNVAQQVAGSNPAQHPKFFEKENEMKKLGRIPLPRQKAARRGQKKGRGATTASARNSACKGRLIRNNDRPPASIKIHLN